MEEYIATGRDKTIVDPDPNQIYTKRRARESSIASLTPSVSEDDVTRVKFPTSGWGKSLEKMPAFTKAEIRSHIESSGKRIANADHHSVPTSLKRAKTFLHDEYLKEIETTDDKDSFYFRCKCYHSYKKNEAPHTIQVALCIKSGKVIQANCTCAAGKVGYCNHTLALMFKICKFYTFESDTTQDLQNESDENPTLACTSMLQRWHKRGRGDTIHPQPVMDVVVTKVKPDDDSFSKGIRCQLYEARKRPKYNPEEEERLKTALASVNPKMGFAVLLKNPPSQMAQTKYGDSPVGSTNCYQLGYTEANFKVFVNIQNVQRLAALNADITAYPRFPLKQTVPHAYPATVSNEEKAFLNTLEVDENELNHIECETRAQADCDRWRKERKFRFTASRFHLISRRQRHHETFAKDLMSPKHFTSRHTVHGQKYEGTAIHEYQKYMTAQKTPVRVLKCGVVVSSEMPVLAASPDGKVIDFGCSQPFGIIEVKCPSTKSAVTPLDACSDPKFFCAKVDNHCCLKIDQEYYAQVQGQMAITGAAWCDFIVYTFKGMSIQRIVFDQHYWDTLKQKLQSYYFQNFISFAVSEHQKDQQVSNANYVV